MEKIKLDKVIVHILDSNYEAPILSIKEIEIEKEIGDFLEKHISRIFNDGDLKKARFNADNNEVLNTCKQLSQNKDQFVLASSRLAEVLFSIMKQNPCIAPADLVCCTFEAGDVRYLSLIKLNYRNSYIHYVSNTDQGNINRIIKQKTVLPNETQRVDECILINMANLELNLLEKQYEICGDKEYYLSKYFLKCESDLSYLQKVKVLDKTVGKISKKHFDEDFEKITKLRSSLAESIEESNRIEIDKVADHVFGENNTIKKEYIDEVKKLGLIDNTVKVPESIGSGKKFRTQKLKTDSGIEINFPSHFYNNKDMIEFINNLDGTISILIKNVGKVVNK